MGFESYFFWASLAALVIAAFLLRSLDVDRTAVRIGHRLAADGLSGRKLLREFRRGGVKLAIWVVGSSEGSDAKHTVTVNQDRSACGNCMRCVNEAIGWIEQQKRAA